MKKINSIILAALSMLLANVESYADGKPYNTYGVASGYGIKNALGSTNGTNNGRNGTTLAGSKTLEICVIDPTLENPIGTKWRYSGVVSAWNQGAIDTLTFTLKDNIQFKSYASGSSFVDTYTVSSFSPAPTFEILAGTTQTTAQVFSYEFDGAPLTDGYIRNSAQLTIMNHSGSIGTPTGPNPKATYIGSIPPKPCVRDSGCTYTQGYWGNKPNVTWPDGYSRDTMFFLSGKTWQEVMDTPVNASQGYYQLAHQYIAATLNMAKTQRPAAMPSGARDMYDGAAVWLASNSPSACTSNGGCGLQKTWAATLDTFNNGVYPDGPPHCEDE